MADYYQDFDRTVEYVDDINCIPNKETAVSVALSIFDGMKKSYEEKNTNNSMFIMTNPMVFG